MAPQESFLNDWAINVQKTCVDEGSVRVRPSRLVSVSSMLGSGLAGSNYSASKWRQEAHDLFGLKRLARAYFKSGGSFTKEEAPENGTNKYTAKIHNSHGNHPSSGTMIKVSNRLPQKRHIYSVSMDSFTDQGKKATITKNSRHTVGNDLSGDFPKLMDTKTTRGTNVSDLNFLHRDQAPAALSKTNSESSETSAERVVQLCNLPKDFGLQSLISQVYGGPLEKINLCNDPHNLSVINGVQLHFASSQAAKSFMLYGQTNHLNINGHILKPEWALKHNSDLFDVNREMMKVSANENNVKESLDGLGVRRCLIVKKTGHSNHSRSRHVYSSRQSLCQFDVKELRKDFEEFGKIVEITPMISRKLCVSISFFDTRSAMSVLESYEKPNSYMNLKYNRDWSITYGRDVTDRPCYMII
ncbi:LANO_0H15654g1_1 [Lachancea nothofagi CBS 11611]|uniref:LANO_0H15654g1_1 n=1 Tax=Lachancea nothofagi CBS 11611 TaxID=1266666 RepID=A0A1G4KMT3_9SACH|nr:LANO_0H15654g1_1 [Lachancea nothofagi CBS 11611]